MSFESIQEYLHWYSIYAIRIQAKALGLKHSKVWKEHELRVLRDGLKDGLSYRQIQKQSLSHRSISAMQVAKADQLGFKTQKKSLWSQKELDDVQKGLKEGLSPNEIVDTYLQSPRRSVNALSSLLCKKKWKRAKQWTKNELFQLDLGLHNGLSLDQIRQSIPHRTLQELKARIQIPNWNDSLYHWGFAPFNVDNIQLSFIAGLILADGSFTVSYSIDLGISEKDQHFLEWICNVFQLPHSKIKQKPKTQSIRLNLNPSLGRFLIKHFQLSPRKSMGQVVFPSFLNEQCLKAFLLGLFYGDGCLSRGRGVLRIDFVSSFDFLKQLLKYMQQNGFVLHFTENNIKPKPTKTSGYDLAVVRLCGREAILFFRFLAEPSIMQQIPHSERKVQDILTCALPRAKSQISVAALEGGFTSEEF